MLYDSLQDNELRNLYDRARMHGLIEFIVIHINFDQLNQIPDENKKSSVLSIANLHKTAYTFGHVDGVSRPGWSSLAPEGTLERIIGNQHSNEGNVKDAILAATASNEGAIFVTEDRRLRNQCIRERINVMNDQEFKIYLIKLLDNTADSITSIN